MDIKIEVEGAMPDRFRAYGPAKGKTKRDGVVVDIDVEDVVAEGEVPAGGKFAASNDGGITRVVLYRGGIEDEVVVGSAEATGTSISCEVKASGEKLN